MPSTSPKMARTMAAAAHDPEFAQRMGIPQGVAREFNAADAGTGILKGKRPKKRRPAEPMSDLARIGIEAAARNASKERRK
jgi:hypothetical protein